MNQGRGGADPDGVDPDPTCKKKKTDPDLNLKHLDLTRSGTATLVKSMSCFLSRSLAQYEYYG